MSVEQHYTAGDTLSQSKNSCMSETRLQSTMLQLFLFISEEVLNFNSHEEDPCLAIGFYFNGEVVLLLFYI